MKTTIKKRDVLNVEITTEYDNRNRTEFRNESCMVFCVFINSFSRFVMTFVVYWVLIEGDTNEQHNKRTMAQKHSIAERLLKQLLRNEVDWEYMPRYQDDLFQTITAEHK